MMVTVVSRLRSSCMSADVTAQCEEETEYIYFLNSLLIAKLTSDTSEMQLYFTCFVLEHSLPHRLTTVLIAIV